MVESVDQTLRRADLLSTTSVGLLLTTPSPHCHDTEGCKRPSLPAMVSVDLGEIQKE